MLRVGLHLPRERARSTFEISRAEGVGWIDLLGLPFDQQKQA